MDKLSPHINASSHTPHSLSPHAPHGLGRSRKQGLRSIMTKTPIRDRDRLDARSDISEGILHPRQMENTYKVEPDPDKRFQHGKVEKVMQEVLTEFLSEVEYSQLLGQRMGKLLADTIKTRVKEFKWTRYKTVVHVVIGENKEQDIRAASRFLWNDKTDSFASATFSAKTLFALAVCFAVYTE